LCIFVVLYWLISLGESPCTETNIQLSGKVRDSCFGEFSGRENLVPSEMLIFLFLLLTLFPFNRSRWFVSYVENDPTYLFYFRCNP